jgi:uncharacterized membrane protein YkgB
MENYPILKDPIKLLVFALAFVYIVFGILKVLNISPVADFVVAMFPLMSNSWMFVLLGISEVALGIGIIWRLTRKWTALLIIGHLAFIFLLSFLNPSQVFSATTVVTFAGEFVAKNVVLMAAAYAIYKS